ncbi:G-protein coupled receptor dmsr-1-like [Mytilus californianus]|uniref:G-protein coupled receptor dmsr-1-like n=1 Tax=Mytilus californianus TaxID=6549 RepID=UPI002247DEC2|nr:G-protein coupled receptor dmsr-1-like [Mytilus californianus]
MLHSSLKYFINNGTNSNINVSGEIYMLHETSTMGNYVASVQEISELKQFENFYKPIHGYLAACVCVFGVLANILNIVVLTRKNMLTSTNVILTGLAISDGLTMALYFPWALGMYIINGVEARPSRDTYQLAQFQMAYAIMSVIVHSVSIWLTVTLAVFRYVFIRFPRRGVRLCNIERAKTACGIVVAAVLFVCLPNSLTYEIVGEWYNVTLTDGTYVNGTVYWVDVKSATGFWEVFKNLNFWIQAIFIKLLPCFLLTVFSLLLLKTMRDAEKRRKRLLNKVPLSDGESGALSSGSNTGKKIKKTSRSNRTTRMLLTVVFMFIITNTPQGILSVLSGLIDEFFHNVYMPLGDLLDIMTLLNNGINFVLYCTMSKQFRETFIKIFVKNSMGANNGVRKTTTYITAQDTQATRDSDV